MKNSTNFTKKFINAQIKHIKSENMRTLQQIYKKNKSDPFEEFGEKLSKNDSNKILDLIDIMCETKNLSSKSLLLELIDNNYEVDMSKTLKENFKEMIYQKLKNELNALITHH